MSIPEVRSGEAPRRPLEATFLTAESAIQRYELHTVLGRHPLQQSEHDLSCQHCFKHMSTFFLEGGTSVATTSACICLHVVFFFFGDNSRNM